MQKSNHNLFILGGEISRSNPIVQQSNHVHSPSLPKFSSLLYLFDLIYLLAQAKILKH